MASGCGAAMVSVQFQPCGCLDGGRGEGCSEGVAMWKGLWWLHDGGSASSRCGREPNSPHLLRLRATIPCFTENCTQHLCSCYGCHFLVDLEAAGHFYSAVGIRARQLRLQQPLGFIGATRAEGARKPKAPSLVLKKKKKRAPSLVEQGRLSASTAVLPFGCPAPAPWLPLHFRPPASQRPLPGSGRPPPCVRSPAPLASPRPAHRD
ncbi:hypothetical protein U9M48_009903 [Paspalum notatum var. saurae]|uniref:Uncharacterized protein n=1 Tax=Paspalum notatum var. saurae TaxID=547442 RepID=A0AAQ3SS01_PASNO